MPTEHGFETEDERNRASAERKAQNEAQIEARIKEQISPYMPTIIEAVLIIRNIVYEYATANKFEFETIYKEEIEDVNNRKIVFKNLPVYENGKIFRVGHIKGRSDLILSVYFKTLKAPNIEIIVELSKLNRPVDIEKLCSILNRNTKLPVTLRVEDDTVGSKSLNNLEYTPKNANEIKVAPVRTKTWVYDNEEQRIEIVRDPKIQADLNFESTSAFFTRAGCLVFVIIFIVTLIWLFYHA